MTGPRGSGRAPIEREPIASPPADARRMETRDFVRNIPTRDRDWEALLDADETEAVETDGGEMALVRLDGQLQLRFSFTDRELMKAAFNPMWGALHPHLASFGVDYVRFDLISFPVREWIDPMLDEAGFLPFGEWLEFERRDLADVTPPEFPAGVRLRRATAADADIAAVVAIEAEAYGRFADGERATRARLATAGWAGVLEAGGEIVGYAINEHPAGAGALVQSLGVAASARGNGYGRLLLEAAAYQLAAAGARRAFVRARPDIRRSAETATAAGFRPARSAVEFRRTLDEAAIEERLRNRQVQGMKVRFGEWR